MEISEYIDLITAFIGLIAAYISYKAVKKKNDEN